MLLVKIYITSYVWIQDSPWLFCNMHFTLQILSTLFTFHVECLAPAIVSCIFHWFIRPCVCIFVTEQCSFCLMLLCYGCLVLDWLIFFIALAYAYSSPRTNMVFGLVSLSAFCFGPLHHHCSRRRSYFSSMISFFIYFHWFSLHFTAFLFL